MHPNVINEGPGICPICNMDLTPMKKAEGSGSDPKGTVTVDPVMVQNMGLRVAKVAEGDISRKVRTVGEVVVAEDRISVINLKYSGWIEKLHVDRTGQRVRKGQSLFTVYSPELVSAQEEYLLALRTAGGKDSPLVRSARTRLAFWDLGKATLARLEKRGKAMRTLTVRSPRSGYVLHKNVVAGARVMAGKDLIRIGKLDAIWVQAQVYEWDAPWVRLGLPATMELSFEKGRLYQGKVSYIYPTLNRKTRTLTVRLEFKNPGLQLKPGMFTTVRIETRKRSGVITVPTEAVLHSGERTLVFVAGEEVGKYAPREVVTGLTGDGHITEIKEGLTAGETVVVSGQFMLDSESQLQEAMEKLLAARLQKKPPGPTWTCPMHDTISEVGRDNAVPQGPEGSEDVEASEMTCPICGMPLEKKEAKK